MPPAREERPLVFGGNDIPGVMMAGAMRAYLNRYGVAPGRSVAIFTTNDSGYALARDLEAAGVRLAAIIDSRVAGASNGVYSGSARIVRGGFVSDAEGGKALSSITIFKDGQTEKLAVDALAMSGGFSPVIHLACQRGGRPEWSDAHAAFIVAEDRKGLALAGAAANVNGLAACLEAGAAKAARLLEGLGFTVEKGHLRLCRGRRGCCSSQAGLEHSGH